MVRLALGLVLMCSAYLALLVHPEPLFAHVVTQQGIRFYSTRPLPAGTAELAREVDRRLRTSELYDRRVVQRVFVVDRPWLWNLLNGPYRRAIARNVDFGNAILVPTLDVARGRIRHFDGREADAASILTHESVHTLVQRRLGVLRTWGLPRWEREGYPEYIASDRGTRSEGPLEYRLAARRWKELIEGEHRTFAQVVEHS